MVRPARLRALCDALGDVEERPHFDRAAFRTAVRTFATLGPSGGDLNVLLPLEVQDMLVASEPDTFVRLNGAWGARGWTRVELAAVGEKMLKEVLREAYALAQPPPKKKRKASARRRA